MPKVTEKQPTFIFTEKYNRNKHIHYQILYYNIKKIQNDKSMKSKHVVQANVTHIPKYQVHCYTYS